MENSLRGAHASRKDKRSPGGIARALLPWLEELVLAVVLFLMVFTFFFRVVTVDGASMLPSYSQGDRLVMLALARSPRQGDVVVLRNEGQAIVKRVLATQGQTVDFDYARKVVLVDGSPVDETAFGLKNGITVPPYASYALEEFPQTVPEGCVFVLGDNRAVSLDSRYAQVGMVDRRDLLGKVLFRVYSARDFEE